MTTDAGQPAGQVPEVATRRGHGADAPDLIELSARTLRSCYTPFLGKQSVERGSHGRLTTTFVSMSKVPGWRATTQL